MEQNAVSVSELNEYIKQIIDSDRELSDVYVKGEISNFKSHTSGHLYFTLKDENSLIRAVMFRSSASKLTFAPESGMKVVCRGKVSVFARDGQYQLYAETMEPDGIGSLYLAYEQLKSKLQKEGLFDESRKKALPKVPSAVGLITSPTGAAVRDMINVTGRRFPHAKIVLYPVLVQGPDAPPQLIEALGYFNKSKTVDVIIIGRGGGSIEDLWAFNDEGVARAVASSSIPVISAVGHETDFTICDFAADRRAATPSQAAEFAVPETDKLKERFLNVIIRETAVINAQIASRREKLTSLISRRSLTDPFYMIDDKRMRTVLESERLDRAADTLISDKRSAFSSLCAKLDVLDPLSVISRGYGVIVSGDEVIKNIAQLKVGKEVTIKTGEGEADAVVKEIRIVER